MVRISPKKAVKLGDGPPVAPYNWKRAEEEKKAREEILNEWCSQFRSGDKTVLFQAISYCGYCRIPMPPWLVDAFDKAYSSRYELRGKGLMKSWNDVFGPPWPKDTKPGEIQRQRNTIWTYVRVKELREAEIARGQNPVTPIDKLFEQIGQEASPAVSAAVISRWFYAAAKSPIVANDPIPGLSQQIEN